MSAKTKRNQPVNRLAAQSRQEPAHEEIALCARSIWEAEGRPQGRELEHWLLAEARLRQGGKPGADAAPRAQPRRSARNGSQRNPPHGVLL